MILSAKARYLLVTLAVLTASAIQFFRGYKLVIILVCGLAFLFIGNLMVYLSGAKERAHRRQLKRDYYEGKI